MRLSCYLALTPEELAQCSAPPRHIAWMACHFSFYGTGLTNIPQKLPPDSMLIINDRVSLQRHDPEQILQELLQAEEALRPAGLLLDLQEPPTPLSEKIASTLAEKLTCPVGVPQAYAHCSDGPVFLAAPPLDIPLQKYASGWKGRELWLEAATETARLHITEKGAGYEVCSLQDRPAFQDETLCCGYKLLTSDDTLTVQLYRDQKNVADLLSGAEELGFTKAIGLYQQLPELALYCT